MASKVKPTARQLEFQSWELGVFCHFGIRTFYEGHRDCDGRQMLPEAFNPMGLDCNQWAETVKRAGGNYMVLTAKHHDGFANWPSAYTRFSVASSPWKDGKGDVVREFVDACRAHGLKIGLYYSPFDSECPAYDDPKGYDDYFINQMSELFGGAYGAIDMVWFDGAHSEGHQYDWRRIIGELRTMQPNILIFNMGDPDYRWCGNEDGYAEYPNWNVTDRVNFSMFTDEKDVQAEGAGWLPQECDFRIRARNWFFSDNDAYTLKSPVELLGNYYYSVGRGANMLLNIAPDRRGLLPEPDCKSLLAMGKEIRRRFSDPVLTTRDFQREGNTWSHQRDYSEDLSKSLLVDHVVIRENLTDGESIRRFRISVVAAHHGTTIPVYEGYNVGNKAICQFPPARSRGLIVEVLESDGAAELVSVEAFLAG